MMGWLSSHASFCTIFYRILVQQCGTKWFYKMGLAGTTWRIFVFCSGKIYSFPLISRIGMVWRCTILCYHWQYCDHYKWKSVVTCTYNLIYRSTLSVFPAKNTNIHNILPTTYMPPRHFSSSSLYWNLNSWTVQCFGLPFPAVLDCVVLRCFILLCCIGLCFAEPWPGVLCCAA